MLSYNEMEKRKMLAETHQKKAANLCCPKCGEKYWERLNKKDKVKGIYSCEKSIIEKDGIFKSKSHTYLYFHCHTCGFSWYTKRV